MDTPSHVLLPSGGNHGYYKSSFIAIWWQLCVVVGVLV